MREVEFYPGQDINDAWKSLLEESIKTGEVRLVARKDTVICLIENYRDSKENFYYLLEKRPSSPGIPR